MTSSPEAALVSSPRLRLIAPLLLGLTACASPQVTPDFYVMPTKTDAEGYVVPAQEKLLPIVPPDSLEEAITIVENLQRQYAWKATDTDDTSANLSTFLIGLASFGLYKSVTHPSTSTAAATGALGASAYAYGTGNKLGARANAYADGSERLSCSLIAAASYRVRIPRRNGNDKRPNSELLAEKIAMSEGALARMQTEAAELAHYNVAVETAQPKSSNLCGNGGWSETKWKSDFQKKCVVTTKPAPSQQPPQRLIKALERASELSARMSKSLAEAHRLDSASRQMGERLWQNAKIIHSNVGRAVRGTIADPLEAVDRVKTYMDRKDGNAADGTKHADAQSGGPNNNASATVRPEDWKDPAFLSALSNLEMRNREAQQVLIKLDGILANNTDIPKRSFDQIDSCRSPADQVAQSILNTVKPATTTTVASTVSYATIPFNAMPDVVFKGLDFDIAKGRPAEAEFSKRIKQCQSKLGLSADGVVTTTLKEQIATGSCRALKWE